MVQKLQMSRHHAIDALREGITKRKINLIALVVHLVEPQIHLLALHLVNLANLECMLMHVAQHSVSSVPQGGPSFYPVGKYAMPVCPDSIAIPLVHRNAKPALLVGLRIFQKQINVLPARKECIKMRAPRRSARSVKLENRHKISHKCSALHAERVDTRTR